MVEAQPRAPSGTRSTQAPVSGDKCATESCSCQSAPTISVHAGCVARRSKLLGARGRAGSRPSARNVFTGHPDPKQAQDNCNAEVRAPE